jgi:hypothetical protein
LERLAALTPPPRINLVLDRDPGDPASTCAHDDFFDDDPT